MTIFVDSSALYAILDRDDAYHDDSARIFNELVDVTRLVTHTYVEVETCALLQRRFGMPAIRRFFGDILPVVEVTPVDAELHRAAVASLLSADQRDVSLVDRVSFEFMRRRGITRVLTFDRDFTVEGFEVL